MPTIALGPPFAGVCRSGDVARITLLDAATGTLSISNSVLFGDDHTVIAGFCAMTPALPPEATMISIDMPWDLSGYLVAEAVPGYAIAGIYGELFALGLPFTFPNFDVHGAEVTMLSVEGGGLSAVGGGFSGFQIDIGFNPFPRLQSTRQYLVAAMLKSRAGCGGWAHAEASLFRSTLGPMTLSF